MYRILVIDDEEEVRHALQRRLQREGFQVDVAEGESDGIAKIRQASPAYDVVITDMAMENPDSGVRILEAALAHDLFSEVIVLTAYGNVANAVECMRRGAFDYVEKNIPGVDVYELLVLKIEQALERRRSAVNTLRRMEEITRRLTSSTRRGD
ncbi:MAG: response regulator [Chthonomonadetes bacterium]|nr:response regulator [Chthonomonadetes bacterium]